MTRVNREVDPMAYDKVVAVGEAIKAALNEGLTINQIKRRFAFRSDSPLRRWLKEQGLEAQALENGRLRKYGGPTLSEELQTSTRLMAGYLIGRIGTTKASKRINVLGSTIHRWARGEVYPSPAKFDRLRELYEMELPR
jgi:hypothetical protein